jgi:hypothetical protein
MFYGKFADDRDDPVNKTVLIFSKFRKPYNIFTL